MEQYYLASGYSHGQKDDMILFQADGSGKMEIVSAYRQGDSPSFLCTAGKRIYAVSECASYASVTAYELQKGKITLIKRMTFAGAGLCHLCAGENMLYASCYGSGQIYVLDNQLREILYCYEGRRDLEETSHMHWTAMADPNILLGADCGRDRIYAFSLKGGIPHGRVREIPLKKGSGPRQILFDRERQVTVIVNEQDGTLLFSKSTFWRQREGNFPWETAEIVSATQRKGHRNYPGGACINSRGEVFAANRGENTIGVFAPDGGYRYRGEWGCGGNWPRYLHVTEENILFAACERSGRVNSFLYRDGQLLQSDNIPLYGAACVVPVEEG